jgi:hypothetical protein
MVDNFALPPELRVKVEEVRRAAQELRCAVHNLEFWVLKMGREIEALPDYGHDVFVPLEAINGLSFGMQLKRQLELSLQALYSHRCLLPSLQGRPLEDALSLLPPAPEGTIESSKDKQFVASTRSTMPALRELGLEVGPFLEHLEFAPQAAISANAPTPEALGEAGAGRHRPAGGEEATRSKPKGGKRPLEQSNAVKHQIYTRIRKEHRPREQYIDVVDRLKADKDFTEQVRSAGLKLNSGLVRVALAFFDQRRRGQSRKKQKTEPA